MANFTQKEINVDSKRASETAPKIINYTRKQLMEFGQSKASNELPKVFNFSGADEKRKEKLRNVFKTSSYSSHSSYSETFEQMPEWANCGPIS